ncbi:hypothetical protein D3C86_1643840 [compost metagenome]
MMTLPPPAGEGLNQGIRPHITASAEYLTHPDVNHLPMAVQHQRHVLRQLLTKILINHLNGQAIQEILAKFLILLFSRFADYSYSLDKADFLHYGLEQQASLASDYWLLLHYGFEGNDALYDYRDYSPNDSVDNLVQKYKSVLKGFPA